MPTNLSRLPIDPYPKTGLGETLRVVAYCPHCEQPHELAPIQDWELALLADRRGWTFPLLDHRLAQLARDLPEAPCVPCVLSGEAMA